MVKDMKGNNLDMPEAVPTLASTRHATLGLARAAQGSPGVSVGKMAVWPDAVEPDLHQQG